MYTAKVTHDFKNQLGIVLGFLELLIAETDASDTRHADLLEVQKAAQCMQAMLPQLISPPVPSASSDTATDVAMKAASAV